MSSKLNKSGKVQIKGTKIKSQASIQSEPKFQIKGSKKPTQLTETSQFESVSPVKT